MLKNQGRTPDAVVIPPAEQLNVMFSPSVIVVIDPSGGMVVMSRPSEHAAKVGERVTNHCRNMIVR